MRSIASCLLWLPLLVPLAALAQIAPEDYTLIGAAVRSRPAYDGSDAQRTDLIPVLRYYGKPWFARTTQGILEGGARWALTPGVDAGVQLAYEEGRESSESDFLSSRNFPFYSSSHGAAFLWRRSGSSRHTQDAAQFFVQSLESFLDRRSPFELVNRKVEWIHGFVH
jgi:hypothetical protein